MEAEFVLSAASPEQFPAEQLPEFAFLGRSNVGKSSLLNCLVGKQGAGKQGLAFTSARPGCTQLVNFYRVDGRFCFVDLPGYGYARVPREITAKWKELIEQYLVHRKALEMCFLILDSRRGWMEKDLELKEWLEFHNRRYVVIATKTDKLKTQKEQHHGFAALRSQASGELLPFSAIQCRGVREIWQTISKTRTQ